MDSLNKLEEAINQLPLSFKVHLVPLIDEVKKDFQEYQNKSVSWSVLDFEGRAKQRVGENWKEVYDENLFETYLTYMISKHDAEFGITWITIDWFLDEYCKK